MEAGTLVDLNYAAHVYKAQGATVDRTYLVTGGWQTHKESFYVACSRSRRGSHLFLDQESLGQTADPDVLAAMATRGAQSGAKVAASTLHSPAIVGHRSAGARRNRPRRVLVDRKPLVETYRRRQRLRWARYEGRRRRETAEYAIEQQEHVRLMESYRPRELAGVPKWVVTAFEGITGMAYGRR
jgi:hypothetical protein